MVAFQNLQHGKSQFNPNLQSNKSYFKRKFKSLLLTAIAPACLLLSTPSFSQNSGKSQQATNQTSVEKSSNKDITKAHSFGESMAEPLLKMYLEKAMELRKKIRKEKSMSKEDYAEFLQSFKMAVTGFEFITAMGDSLQAKLKEHLTTPPSNTGILSPYGFKLPYAYSVIWPGMLTGIYLSPEESWYILAYTRNQPSYIKRGILFYDQFTNIPQFVKAPAELEPFLKLTGLTQMDLLWIITNESAIKPAYEDYIKMKEKEEEDKKDTLKVLLMSKIKDYLSYHPYKLFDDIPLKKLIAKSKAFIWFLENAPAVESNRSTFPQFEKELEAKIREYYSPITYQPSIKSADEVLDVNIMRKRLNEIENDVHLHPDNVTEALYRFFESDAKYALYLTSTSNSEEYKNKHALLSSLFSILPTSFYPFYKPYAPTLYEIINKIIYDNLSYNSILSSIEYESWQNIPYSMSPYHFHYRPLKLIDLKFWVWGLENANLLRGLDEYQLKKLAATRFAEMIRNGEILDYKLLARDKRRIEECWEILMDKTIKKK